MNNEPVVFHGEVPLVLNMTPHQTLQTNQFPTQTDDGQRFGRRRFRQMLVVGIGFFVGNFDVAVALEHDFLHRRIGRHVRFDKLEINDEVEMKTNGRLCQQQFSINRIKMAAVVSSLGRYRTVEIKKQQTNAHHVILSKKRNLKNEIPTMELNQFQFETRETSMCVE